MDKQMYLLVRITKHTEDCVWFCSLGSLEGKIFVSNGPHPSYPNLLRVRDLNDLRPINENLLRLVQYEVVGSVFLDPLV